MIRYTVYEMKDDSLIKKTLLNYVVTCLSLKLQRCKTDAT